MPAEELTMSHSTASPVQDAMPTTRGMNFYLEDANLAFVCSSVMDAVTLDVLLRTAQRLGVPV